MATDYTGNSHKDRDKPVSKAITPVVQSKVVVKKKGVGAKFKETFFGGSLKVAGAFILADVVLPAMRDLVVDSISKGISKVMYGEPMNRNRSPQYSGRINYSNPSSLGMVDPRTHGRLPNQRNAHQQSMNEILFQTREDALTVKETMIEMLDQFDSVSAADLYSLVGLPFQYVDNNFGWTNLHGLGVMQTTGGQYILSLPPLEALE